MDSPGLHGGSKHQGFRLLLTFPSTLPRIQCLFSWPQMLSQPSPQTPSSRKEKRRNKKKGEKVYTIYFLWKWPFTEGVPFIRDPLMPAVKKNPLFILPYWTNNICLTVLLQRIIQDLAQQQVIKIFISN